MLGTCYYSLNMIEINNLTTSLVDKAFLKKVAKIVLEGEGLSEEFNLSIALVGQGRIRELNQRYRKKNRVTDVLSFPESKILLEKFRIGPLQKAEGLGEIVICLREVKKNAKRFKNTFEKELAKILIHGILHLLGYDHKKDNKNKKAKEMKEKEEYYLSNT